MPRFEYQAMSQQGDMVAGEIEDTSVEQVIAGLRARALLPVRVVAIASRPSRSASGWGGFRPVVPRAELAGFFRQLARLLAAGLALDRALELLTTMTRHGRSRALFTEILARVRDGASLSAAMAARENAVPRIGIAMVRAGEESGALTVVLARVADFLARSEAIRQKVISAAIYPAILLVAAMVSIGLILGYVLPEFEAMFRDAGARLTGTTWLVMTTAAALREYGWLIMAGMVAVAAGLALSFRRPGVARRRDRFLLRLPVLGGLITRFDIGQFCHSLAILLGNGVPAAQAVPLAGATVSNLELAAAVARFGEDVREGGGIARSLARSGYFPDLPIQLIQIGEETGRLPEMLTEVAQIYDEEVERLLERLMAALVPAITVGLGIVVGLIVVAVITAMIGVNALAL